MAIVGKVIHEKVFPVPCKQTHVVNQQGHVGYRTASNNLWETFMIEWKITGLAFLAGPQWDSVLDKS